MRASLEVSFDLGTVTFRALEHTPEAALELKELINQAGLKAEFTCRYKLGRLQVGRPRNKNRRGNSWTMLLDRKTLPLYGHSGPA